MHMRDPIRCDTVRAEREQFERLKAELVTAFAAPETAYREVDAETVIRRNARR